MNQDQPSIELSNVSKIYMSEKSIPKVAVNNVSLKIENGQRLGIVGKNGAGKSTLLHMIAGLSEPSSGKITVNGQVTSIMTLGLGLREDLTGRENIYVDGEIQGRTRVEIDGLINEIISFADLEEFIDYPLRTYSTGMKSRLAFSMITCISPEILIIDEALSAGDAAFSLKATAKVREICEKGKIVIIVSHGMQSIRDLCNRCLWMENGRILADGGPEEITQQYLEAVREEDEQILKKRFKSLAVSHSKAAGFSIDLLELSHANEQPARFIVDSGKDIAVSAAYKVPSHSSEITVRLKITRIDGLVMIDESSPIVPQSSKLKISIPQFPLSKGTYELSLYLTENGKELAGRTLIFETTCIDPPRGGKPALMYPSSIRAQPGLVQEREK